MRLLSALFLVNFRVAYLSETLVAKLTGKVLFLQVHSFQMSSGRCPVAQETAAEATQPATVVHNGETCLDRLE